jgi:choline dehydrogenase-like flavoprotein
MIYSRGNKHDYNYWAENGMRKWSWKDVLPYFKKSEDSSIGSSARSKHHDSEGEINIENLPYKSALAEAFLEANKEMGLKEVDYNSGEQIGVSYPQMFTKNGHRHSAFKAFIEPVLHRPNLDLMIRTTATKIIIDDSRKATGVEVIRDKKSFVINARNEVIVTAGALNSPKLLMQSGIGPDKVLRRAGIPQILSSPVGQGLSSK